MVIVFTLPCFKMGNSSLCFGYLLRLFHTCPCFYSHILKVLLCAFHEIREVFVRSLSCFQGCSLSCTQEINLQNCHVVMKICLCRYRQEVSELPKGRGQFHYHRLNWLPVQLQNNNKSKTLIIDNSQQLKRHGPASLCCLIYRCTFVFKKET